MILKIVFAALCLGCSWLAWKVVGLWRTQEPNHEPLTAWEWALGFALLFAPPAGAITFAVLFFKQFP